MFSRKYEKIQVFLPDSKESDTKMIDTLLQDSYAYCLNIMKENSQSFFFASRFLPDNQRNSVASWYAFARLTDDLVDEGNFSPSKIDQQLDNLKESIKQLANGYISNNPILYAFGATIRKHNIPISYVYDLIDGVKMDLTKNRYSNFEELELYCYRVASTIGLVMTHIFQDNPSPKTLARAADLGLAMQMTNILRDIKEDYIKRNRIYIPKNVMEQYSVTEEDFKTNIVSVNLKELIKYEIELTKGIYKIAELGIKELPKSAQYTIYLASRVYAGILNEIKKRDYQILTQRAVVSKKRKFLIALKVRLMFWNIRKELG
ncbi:MAG: phytoene/squalene synthase family protein [Candidatus Thorarchaeota archaeon]